MKVDTPWPRHNRTHRWFNFLRHKLSNRLQHICLLQTSMAWCNAGQRPIGMALINAGAPSRMRSWIMNADANWKFLHWATDEHSTHNPHFVIYILVRNVTAHKLLHSQIVKQRLYGWWVNATVLYMATHEVQVL